MKTKSFQFSINYNLNYFQEGILVRGIFITGAGWDPKELVLVNATPLQFHSPLSVMHFKPILKTEKVVDDRMLICTDFYFMITEPHKQLYLYIFFMQQVCTDVLYSTAI